MTNDDMILRVAMEEVRGAQPRYYTFDAMANAHEEKSIKDKSYEKAIENSPAKKLLRKFDNKTDFKAGDVCPECGVGKVESAITKKEVPYFRCSTFKPGAAEQICDFVCFSK